jgi:hypothetical protein
VRIVTAIAFLVGLAGCATQAKFETKMNGFVGQPEAALVGTYGPPQASYTLADGSRVLQYTRGGQVLLPGATTYQPVTSSTAGNLTLNQGARQTTGTYTQQTTSMVPVQQPGVPLNLACTVNFTVDAAGTVRQWSASGNHCVAN